MLIPMAAASAAPAAAARAAAVAAVDADDEADDDDEEEEEEEEGAAAEGMVEVRRPSLPFSWLGGEGLAKTDVEPLCQLWGGGGKRRKVSIFFLHPYRAS